MYCGQKGKVVWIVGGGPMVIHSSRQTDLSFSHIEIITLGADEEVDEVAGGASSIGVDRIGEVDDRASEGQTAGVYGAGFTTESLTRKGAFSKAKMSRLSYTVLCNVSAIFLEMSLMFRCKNYPFL